MPDEAPSLRLSHPPTPIDWGVLLLAIALLAYGAQFASSTVPRARVVTALDGHLDLTLPAGWVGEEAGGEYHAHTSIGSLDRVVPTLTVSALEQEAPNAEPIPEGEFLGDAPPAPQEFSFDVAVAQMHTRRREAGVGYRVLDTTDGRAFGAARTAQNRFAMVTDPPGTVPGSAVIPEVVIGVDALIDLGDAGVFQLSLVGPAESWERTATILDGLAFSAEGAP